MPSTALETSDDLLIAFKRDSYIASSQGNFDDTQLLAVADIMTTKHVVPLLKSLDSGWYISFVDVPLTATSRYTIPQYAMYGMLYKASLIRTADLQTVRTADAQQTVELTPVVEGDWPLYYTSSQGTPNAYLLRHNYVRLNCVPGPSDIATLSLRMHFFRRPGRLVKVIDSAKVLSVNTVTGVVTYTAPPPATFTAVSQQEFYQGQSPFVRRESDVQASAVLGSTQTFPVVNVTQLVPGDYVTLTKETIFPDLPIELYPFLLDLMELHLARAKTDAQVTQDRLQKTMEDMRNAMASSPGDRVKGQRRKMSLLNSGLVGARRRRLMINT